MTMKARLLFLSLTAVSIMGVVYLPCVRAQAPQSDSGQAPSGPPGAMQAGPEASRRGNEGPGRGVFGKISALQADSIEITGQDGTKVSLKLTSSTAFRKDRQPANRSDFKVGDSVVVRTNQDSGGASGATALLVAAAPAGGFGGRGGGGGQGMMQGTMGKDYVVGEVKSVDAPKLTILRVDSATQTLELNEETSLRRGRESVAQRRKIRRHRRRLPQRQLRRSSTIEQDFPRTDYSHCPGPDQCGVLHVSRKRARADPITRRN